MKTLTIKFTDTEIQRLRAMANRLEVTRHSLMRGAIIAALEALEREQKGKP